MWNNSIIDVQDLPQITTPDYKPIQRSYLVVILLRRLLTIVIICSIFVGTIMTSAGGSVIALLSTSIVYLIPILLILVIVFSAYQKVRRQGYLLREKDISHKKGWLNQTFTSVPFNRIQHVEVTQGLAERWLTLATLKIFTAGGNSSDLRIPGVTKVDAERLKTFLLVEMSSLTSSSEEE